MLIVMGSIFLLAGMEAIMIYVMALGRWPKQRSQPLRILIASFLIDDAPKHGYVAPDIVFNAC